jgi:autotransporter translocation and assembly factor TamB
VKRLFRLIGLLLVILIAALGWLLATSSGGALLLHLALGAKGDFTSFRGSLLSGPQLHGLIYRDAAQEIGIGQLALDWQPSALLQGRLHVRSIRGEGVDYRWLGGESSPEEPPPTPAGAPPTLPVQILLDEARITRLSVATPSDSWTLDLIDLGVHTEGQQIRLQRLEAEGLGATLSARGSLALSPDYPFQADLDWTFTHALSGAAAGSGRVEGDLRGLKLSHRVDQPAQLETRGRVDFADTGVRLDLDGDWESLRWPLVGDAPIVSSPEGRYRLRGAMDALVLEAGARLEPIGSPPLDLEWSERITPTGTEDLQMQIRLPRGRAELRGEVSWSPEIRWSARLDGEDLDPSLFWPDGEGNLALSVQPTEASAPTASGPTSTSPGSPASCSDRR